MQLFAENPRLITNPHQMKYLSVACFFLPLLLTSCAQSVHIIHGGQVDTPKKNSYEVTYQTNLEEGLTAGLSYADSDGEMEKLKGVAGNWSKTLSLKSHQTLQLKISAKGLRKRAEFKIFVDGKVISEHVMVSKKMIYNMRFELP
jgi:hypothetical protein